MISRDLKTRSLITPDDGSKPDDGPRPDDTIKAAGESSRSSSSSSAMDKAVIAEHMDRAGKLVDEMLEEIMRELFAEQVGAGGHLGLGPIGLHDAQLNDCMHN